MNWSFLALSLSLTLDKAFPQPTKLQLLAWPHNSNSNGIMTACRFSSERCSSRSWTTPFRLKTLRKKTFSTGFEPSDVLPRARLLLPLCHHSPFGDDNSLSIFITVRYNKCHQMLSRFAFFRRSPANDHFFPPGERKYIFGECWGSERKFIATTTITALLEGRKVFLR